MVSSAALRPERAAYSGYKIKKSLYWAVLQTLVQQFFVFVFNNFLILILLFCFLAALAVIAGLFGAVLGSAHPIAAALVSAIAGALVAGVAMVICIATMPDHVFGVRTVHATKAY